MEYEKNPGSLDIDKRNPIMYILEKIALRYLGKAIEIYENMPECPDF